MLYFLKYLKGIVYFLITVILFQSCIAYKGQNSSVAEAADIEKRHIKITTTNGGIYKLGWIEEKDGNVVSIKNTKLKYFDKTEVDKILIYNPKPNVVSLEEAQNHKGTILLRTNKFKDRHPYVIDSYNHSFLKIADDGDQIKGYKMTGKDTLSVVIPVSQIEKIQLESKGGTIVGTTLIVIPGLYILTGIVFGIAYIIGMLTYEGDF